MPKFILVVDDNSIQRLSLTNQLTIMLDHTVKIVEAIDGMDAIAKVEQHRTTEFRANFKLIIMDQEMPNLTGVEAIARIRKLENKYSLLPSYIAMWTTTNTNSPQADAKLMKPFTPEALRELLIKANFDRELVTTAYEEMKFTTESVRGFATSITELAENTANEELELKALQAITVPSPLNTINKINRAYNCVKQASAQSKLVNNYLPQETISKHDFSNNVEKILQARNLFSDYLKKKPAEKELKNHSKILAQELKPANAAIKAQLKEIKQGVKELEEASTENCKVIKPYPTR